MAKRSLPGQIRIIAGQWRGRKLTVADQPGLRPTPDRVRETLFNWLQHDIVDAQCVDMFAGSGALGFEALSRGAACVDFMDNAIPAIQQLQKNLAALNITNARVHHGNALAVLPTLSKKFDIVFLDPPFQQKLLSPCCALLEKSACLSEHNRIYMESDQPLADLNLSKNWQCLHQKKASKVFYGFFSLG